VDFAAGHDRDLLVQQIHQRAQDARLRLSPEAEEDEIVPGKNRVDDLRDDGIVVPDNARKERRSGWLLGDQVFSKLVLDGTVVHAAGIDSSTQLSQGFRGHVCILTGVRSPGGRR